MTDTTVRYAVIEDGIVTNITLADEAFATAQGWVPAAAARIGDLYDAEAGTFSAPPLPPLDRAAAAREIDEACRLALAPRLAFMKEYEEREAQALAFRAAGYPEPTEEVPDPVPPRIVEFAVPAGLSPRSATDLILAQAASMRADIGSLAELRMRKYEVLRAGTDAQARAALAEILALIQPIAARLA